MNEKISVIVAVYKVEKYLSRCIESLLNQTYQNLEILLVDDGSPDDSGNICDEYAMKDSRIKVIHQTNQGAASARNKALMVMTGDYFGFVDSDDYIHSTMFEVLLNKIKEHQVDIAMCNYARVTKTEKAKSLSTSTIGKENILDTQQMLGGMYGIEGEKFSVIWNKLYKKKFMEVFRFPEGILNEDEAVIYKVYDQAEHMINLEVTLYYYMVNEESVTGNYKYLLTHDIYRIFQERITFFQENQNIQMEQLTKKSYLDRIISRYQKLIVIKDIKIKKEAKKLKRIYNQKYKEFRFQVKTTGYQIFYFSPKLYKIIVKLKCK